MPWKKSEPVEQRAEFALKALKSENFRALCQEYGISTKTGYKWRERFLSRGIAGLTEESRAPRGHCQELKPEEVCSAIEILINTIIYIFYFLLTLAEIIILSELNGDNHCR
jgi:transposase